jgi:hypothetical protein
MSKHFNGLTYLCTNAARRGFPYRQSYREIPLEPQVWNYFCFRVGATKRGRFAGAWVAEGREEEARTRLEAAFGELSAWHPEVPPQDAPQPPPLQKEQPQDTKAEPAPDVAVPNAAAWALVEALEAEWPIGSRSGSRQRRRRGPWMRVCPSPWWKRHHPACCGVWRSGQARGRRHGR